MARAPMLQPTRAALPAQAQKDLRGSLLDRVIETVAPRMAADRMQARANLVLWRMNSGQYQSARTDRPNTRGWTPRAQSADDDVRGDQEPIRARARAAVRDMPLAAAIALTLRTGTIGIGCKAYPRLDPRVLRLSDAERDVYEADLRMVFDEFAESPWASFDGTMDHYEQQATVLVGMCVNGDEFALLRDRTAPVDGSSRVAVQLIESDLVSTPNTELANAQFRDGCEYDAQGVLRHFHVADRFPSAPTVGLPITWRRLAAWREDNRPNCLHIVGDRRAGQARGVSDFAPILEVLKAISDLMDNELTAALVASLFTVFMASADAPPVLDPDEGVPVDADGNIIDPEAEDAGSTPRDVKGPPMKLGSGLIAYGLPGEQPKIIESARPNPNFAPFFLALAQVASAANNMPVSLVLKRFMASYTASQAEMIEAWRHFLVKRTKVVRKFSAPVREAVIADAVSRGRLQLPGFFADPKKRRAWLQCDWRGPTKGHMNPLQEAKALEILAKAGIASLEDIIAGYNAKSFEETHDQRKKEVRWRVADSLEAPVTVLGTAVQTGDAEIESQRDLDDDTEPTAPTEESPL